MRKIRSVSGLAAVAVASAVAVAAPASAGAQESTATAAAKKDIVQTAAGAGQFDTLASLLKKAGLVKALKDQGPYTVFAPTDAAFAKVPRATLDQLGQDKAKLRSVLLYHVAGRKLTAEKITERRSVKTLNGQSVRVRTSGKTVRVGGARVSTADVGASNGVIHVIDEVLIPR